MHVEFEDGLYFHIDEKTFLLVFFITENSYQILSSKRHLDKHLKMQAPVVVMSKFPINTAFNMTRSELKSCRHPGWRQTSGSQGTTIEHHSSKDVSKRRLECKCEGEH